jgi:hypothetical protein
MTKQTVPFLQIVLGGYAGYYGTPVNKSSDKVFHVLRSIEYGTSGISYLLSATGNTEVWEMEWNEYRNTLYTDHINEISDFQKQINEYVMKTGGAALTDHREVQDKVFRSTFDNGIQVYVNYNEKDVLIEGIEIAGMSFDIAEGQE